MKNGSNARRQVLGGAATVIAALTAGLGSVPPQTVHAQGSVDVRVMASGLNDPRGLAFAPGGDLFIAEAGSGGANISTVGQCDQVQPPVGPALGGDTGRILKLAPSGTLTVFATGLPSSEDSPLIGGDKQGVSDVAIVDQQVLALISGAGCSHGHADANNGVMSFRRGSYSMIADLSAWLLANPGAKGAEQPRNADYEPDGTWFSMLVQEDKIYAVEPNHGLLVSIDRHDHAISLVQDLFATFGDHTYTSLATDREDLYVGTLGQIAFGAGGLDFVHSFEAGIYRLPRNGAPEQVASGLHAVLGVAFDDQHRMYALQSPIFIPGTGSLVRINADGSLETLVGGLNFPASLRRGPDHAFYFSECSYHCAPGDGRVVRVAVD